MPGSKNFIHEANWQRECLRPQIRGVPHALWHADNTVGARQRSLRDATIMGSRNGHAPIFLWYGLNMKGYRGFQKEVQKCLRNAHYFKGRLCLRGLMMRGLCTSGSLHAKATLRNLDDFLNELVV
ncbi:Serine decarboxylase 1 [Glycine soja]|uniref:Histidine decarboxylase n=1 Tax=Glycine soja TaxID=3848 RepID=A0A0B2NPZ9_GLYSO|nr:hypothetical protein JHK87_012641 [Glycine soja]KHM99129.1 Histidine decarboxylase [Glycine soja]